MRNSAQKTSVALLGICLAFLGSSTARAERLIITYKTAGMQRSHAAQVQKQVQNKIEALPSARILKQIRGGAVVQTSAGDKKQVIAQLKQQAGVRSVEVDRKLKLLAGTPNDTYWSSLWGMSKIGLPAAWDSSTGSGMIVAVIDTGVETSHPDLSGQMWVNSGEVPGNGIDDDHDGIVDDVYGADFTKRDSQNRPLGNPADQNGHGTHVSGTIAATRDNNIGVAGVAPGAKIMALRFMDANGAGYTSDAILAIDYAIAHGAKILNNSWGGPGYSQALSDAITRAKNAGVLFVAAAGNESTDVDKSPSYPAAYTQDNVLTIAATDSNDLLASFSNWGLTQVDMGAPGVGITSSYIGARYGTMSGTSMATPHVAGSAAWLWAARPSATYGQIKQALMDGGYSLASLSNKTVSGRRLALPGALSALDSILGGNTPTPPPTPPPGQTLIPTVPPSVQVIGTLVICNPGSWPVQSAKFTYAWSRAGQKIGSVSPSVVITDNNWTGPIVCQVTVTKDNATGTASSQPLVVPKPIIQVSPRLNGATAVGKTVTCNPGKWIYGPISYSYKWYNSYGLINGASSSTYTPGSLDVNRWIYCVVTASNASGSSSFSSDSGLVRGLNSRSFSRRSKSNR